MRIMTLFDHAAACEARDAGMAQAAEGKRSLLRFARGLAVELAERQGEVTADDVQRALAAHGVSVRALGNAAGSLFVGAEWEWTGKFRKSERVHSHQNLLRVWRLRR